MYMVLKLNTGNFSLACFFGHKKTKGLSTKIHIFYAQRPVAGAIFI